MNRFVLCSAVIVATGLLMGCEQSTTPEVAPSQSPPEIQSYRYRADPPVYKQATPVAPSTSSSDTAPAQSASQKNAAVDQASSTEQNAPSEKESVQGFPPGHPLYQENQTQNTESALNPAEPVSHHVDSAAHSVEPTTNQADENAIPSNDQSEYDYLPHTNHNY